MPEPENERYAQQDSVTPRHQAGETPRLADDPNARAELEAKLSSALGDVEEPESPGVDETPTDDTDAPEQDEQDSDQDESDASPEADKPVEQPSTLPDSWRRSLKARGWDDETIDNFWTERPDLAATVFEKVHVSRNEELSQWAALGRAHRAIPEASAVVAPKPTEKPALTAIDVEALVAQSGGSEEVIRAFADPLNRVIEQLNQVVPHVQRSVEDAKARAQETLGAQVEAFFGRDDAKPFSAVFGESAKNLTAEQLAARGQVLEQADALMAGALLQGRKLAVEEALEMGFDIVTSDQKIQAARSELRKSVKKRAKGLTLKPSARRSAPATGKRSRAQLESVVEEGLTKIFG